jgi:hypothetical protein
MATDADTCPLCGLPAESFATHVAGGRVREGVRSFRCAHCKGFIVHDDARHLLAGLDDEKRKELSREAMRREDAHEARLEITRAMMPPPASDRPFSIEPMDAARARQSLVGDLTATEALVRAEGTGILFAGRFGKKLSERALILVCEFCRDVGWIAVGPVDSYPAMKADLERRATRSGCEHWRAYCRAFSSP